MRSIHPDFPVLEPSSLTSALEALYHSSASPIDPSDMLILGWPMSTPVFRWNGRTVVPRQQHGDIIPLPTIAFIIFMVLNLASLVKVRARNYTHSPDKFYQAAMSFAQPCFSQSSLTSIQSLVTLVVHNMLAPAETNLWTLLHVALAHCIEIGVQREEPHEADDFDHQQVRRYIFYTIYSLDRSISSIQGRPLGFRDETFDIQLPKKASPPSNSSDPPPIASSLDDAVIEYTTAQFTLARIVSDIKLHLYHLPGAVPSLFDNTDPAAEQRRIQASLEAWWTTVSPADFNCHHIDSTLRKIWQSNLKIKHHTTMILLHQPSQALRHPSPESLRTCFDSASVILQTYQHLQDMSGLQYGWRSIQNIFAAGATLIYSFWTSASARQHVSPTDLMRSLRICTSLLTVGGEWWPSAKKCQSSFDAVADLTIQRLFTDPPPSKVRRRASSRRQGSLKSQPGDLEVAPAEGTTSFDTADSADLADDGWATFQEAPDAWQSPADATILGSFAPEVENFLADFDRSEFSWSFPMFDADVNDLL